MSYKLSLMGFSDNSRLDILGFYYISVNLESQTATNSFVNATLYDKDGK
jgi:hypothetical protein